MCWKIEKEIFGSLLKIQVSINTMVNPFSILQQRTGLAVIQLFIFMKIEPVIFGLVPEVEQAVTMGNLFEISPQKMDFPVTVFVYSLKTKPASFGLVHKEKICSFMMEKHLPF